MKRPKIGIVGMGVVGKHMSDIFPWANCFDSKSGPFCNFLSLEMVNQSEFCFVCVPTPMSEKGNCDISIVERVVAWLKAEIIIIKSTVEIGVTDRLAEKYDKQICFSPEFHGETPHSRPLDNFVILGGSSKITSRVRQLYQRVKNGSFRIRHTDAKTAELVKYMENSFLACKVVFCNEFYRLAKRMGVDYSELRELFLLDSRQSPSHTFVYTDMPFYDSKCLNKDLPAIVISAKKAGLDLEFVKSIIKRNEQFKMEMTERKEGR